MVPVIALPPRHAFPQLIFMNQKKRLRLFPPSQTHTPFTSLHLLTLGRQFLTCLLLQLGSGYFNLVPVEVASILPTLVHASFSTVMLFYKDCLVWMDLRNMANLISWHYNRPMWGVRFWVGCKVDDSWVWCGCRGCAESFIFKFRA